MQLRFSRFSRFSTRRDLALLLLVAATAACAAPPEGEDVESTETDLTRTETVYRFATKARLAGTAELVVGASKEGAIVLAAEGSASAATNRTRTYVWNGTTLEDRGDVGPFYANGSMAYDAATGTTWYLQESANSTTRYESLYRWHEGAWAQRYSRVAEAKLHRLYVDSRSGKLMRVTERGIDEYREEGTPTQPVRRFFAVEGGSYERPAVAYDTARQALVVFGAPMRERRAAASPWAPAVWTSVAASRPTPPGVYLGYCDDALFDAGRATAVQLCSSYGKDGFAFEWDGASLGFARTVADPILTFVPRHRAYDVVHGAIVGVDWNWHAAGGAAFQVATREQATTANAKPELHDASKSFEIYATEEAKLPLSAVDADHDPVTVSLPALPAGATFDGKTLTWTPTVADQGPHLLDVQLGDGEATVTRKTSVTVKVVSYPELAADVAVNEDFWFHGSASLRGATRGAQAHAVCKIAGKNPGAVRARCSVNAEICTGGGYPSASPCSTTAMVGIAAEGVLSPNGTLHQRTSEARSCASQTGGCPRWSGSVSMKLDAAGNVCVSYDYQRDSFAHAYSGQARSSGTSCPSP